MGLDNIPHAYPCRKAGTAMLSDPDPDGDQMVRCADTQAMGGCPLITDPTWPKKGLVLGLFGTECWYRGKAGTYLLADYDDHAYLVGGEPMPVHLRETGFYGPNVDTDRTPDLPPDYCRELGGWMGDHAETYAAIVATGQSSEGGENPERQESAVASWCYAAWYLKWSAEHSDGLDAWY